MGHQTFLVTGASRGIGLAISNLLMRQGHHVVGIARNSDAEFSGTLISCDLCNLKQTDEVLQDIAELAVRLGSALCHRCVRSSLS